MPSTNRVTLTIVAIGMLSLAYLAGDVLPIPWPDELHFMLPAYELGTSFSLSSRALHPSRPLFWMPPGYFFFLAPFFKFFGFSLQIARIASLLCLLSTMFISVLCLERAQQKKIAILFFGILFFLPGVMVASNFARMEALQVTFAFVTLWFALNKRFDIAFPIALLSGLIHFNAIFTLLALVVACFFSWHQANGEQPFILIPKKRWIQFFWVGTLLLGAAYSFYVLLNWSFFQADMQMQFTRKLHRVPFYKNFKYLVPTGVALLALGLGVLGTFLNGKRLEYAQLCLLVFGLAWVLIFAIGQEMTYYVWLLLGLGLICVTSFDTVSGLFPKLSLGFLCLPLLIGLAFTKGKGYVYAGMQLTPKEPYLSAEAYDEVHRVITNLASRDTDPSSKSPFKVLIEPSGVGVYFVQTLAKNNLELVVNTPVYKHPKVDYTICIFNQARSPLGMLERLKQVCPDFPLDGRTVVHVSQADAL